MEQRSEWLRNACISSLASCPKSLLSLPLLILLQFEVPEEHDLVLLRLPVRIQILRPQLGEIGEMKWKD